MVDNVLSKIKEKHETLKEEFFFDNDKNIRYLVGEFWTSKQRQGNSIHEVSYRACFKSELPKFFIDRFTKKKDLVYDPFSGRGTTGIQAALSGRVPIFNDINPLSIILSKPRIFLPDLNELEERLNYIFNELKIKKVSNELPMFYDDRTFNEINHLKEYLKLRKKNKEEDCVDDWIRMVATNRLSGHSSGFFSVYTLPPNQATSPKRQIEINKKRKQKPDYRNVSNIILKKSKKLLSEIDVELLKNINYINNSSMFLNKDSRFTKEIKSNTVKLVVTSPPFLDIVNYAQDNWLRCWFNDIDSKKIQKNITVTNNIKKWEMVMEETLIELKRVLVKNGIVAFEVGEVRKGSIKLDEIILTLAKKIGFGYVATLINKQNFTKTSNIWGIKNNDFGTNTNRVVLLVKI